MTLDDLVQARARGETRTDWAKVKADYDAGKEPAADDDAPDVSAQMAAQVTAKRVGRPVGSDKTQVAIRVDNDVLTAFKATGKGWQTRMNAALKDWLKTHSPA